MPDTPYTHRVPKGRLKVTGRLGPALQTPLPSRILGTVQKAGGWTPTACPHCRAEPPMWVVDAYSGMCRTCGADWFVTTTFYQVPQPKNLAHPRPVWLPNVR